MTHDEALLWLSDRLGKSVNVSVELDRGDVGTVVLEGEGTLEHWSEPIDERARALVVPRDDLVGWYRVGDTRFDLTEFAEAKGDADELVVLLSDSVRLRIVEQQEL
jgi:hypothetical protein